DDHQHDHDDDHSATRDHQHADHSAADYDDEHRADDHHGANDDDHYHHGAGHHDHAAVHRDGGRLRGRRLPHDELRDGSDPHRGRKPGPYQLSALRGDRHRGAGGDAGDPAHAGGCGLLVTKQQRRQRAHDLEQNLAGDDDQL